jgi:hypothetical protein
MGYRLLRVLGQDGVVRFETTLDRGQQIEVLELSDEAERERGQHVVEIWIGRSGRGETSRIVSTPTEEEATIH